MLPNHPNRLPYYANPDSAVYNLDGLQELKDDSVSVTKYSNPNAWPISLKKATITNDKEMMNRLLSVKGSGIWLIS